MSIYMWWFQSTTPEPSHDPNRRICEGGLGDAKLFRRRALKPLVFCRRRCGASDAGGGAGGVAQRAGGAGGA